MGCSSSLDIDIKKSLWLVTAQAFANKLSKTPIKINLGYCYRSVEVWINDFYNPYFPYSPYYFKPQSSETTVDLIPTTRLDRKEPSTEAKVAKEHIDSKHSDEKTKYIAVEKLPHWTCAPGSFKVDTAVIDYEKNNVKFTLRATEEDFGFTIEFMYDPSCKTDVFLPAPTANIFGVWNGGFVDTKSEIWAKAELNRVESYFNQIYQEMLHRTE